MTLEEFDAEWDRCAPWIEAALEWSLGTHLLEDVKELVLTDRAQFWPGTNAAAVSEISVQPRMKILHFWLCGGDMREILEEMLPVAEAWGVTQGCSRFTTAGRIGWRRVMAKHGYSPAWESCVKDLADVHWR